MFDTWLLPIDQIAFNGAEGPDALQVNNAHRSFDQDPGGLRSVVAAVTAEHNRSSKSFRSIMAVKHLHDM
jgi:hypothetical protein